MVERKENKKEQKTPTRYLEGVGRRKTAIARVRLEKGTGRMMVNDKDPKQYFHSARERTMIHAPLESLRLSSSFDVSARVSGGGLAAQADAVALGLARALVLFDAEFKKRLRHLGFLTRDSRMVERKKYGLKKARRAPQWAKR